MLNSEQLKELVMGKIIYVEQNEDWDDGITICFGNKNWKRDKKLIQGTNPDGSVTQIIIDDGE